MSEPRDLSLLLACSIALGDEAPRAGASLTRRNRAAKQLGDAYARVTRARAVAERHRYVQNDTAERELRSALDAFADLAATALGLEAP